MTITDTRWTTEKDLAPNHRALRVRAAITRHIWFETLITLSILTVAVSVGLELTDPQNSTYVTFAE